MKIQTAILLMSLLSLTETVFSQERSISGKVIDLLSGKPLSGIKVKLKNAPIFSTTDSTGVFNFNVHHQESIEFEAIPEKEVLQISQISANEYHLFVSALKLTDMSLEELINIKVQVSSSQAKTVFQTPSTVSIVDRQMLDKYNFLSVAEMLRTVVGFDIYQTNNDDNVATSRGISQNYYANKILVMIENIPVYQPLYGNTNLDRIDVNDVERLEVLKGPASVLYGSNAYLGVVNIILRKGKDGELNSRIGAGYHRFGSAGTNFSVKTGKVDLFISGNGGFEVQKPYLLEGKVQDLYNGKNKFYFQRELKSSNVNLLAKYGSFSLLVNHFEYQHTFLGINPSFTSGGNKPMNDRGTLASIRFDQPLTKKTGLQVDVSVDLFNRNYASNTDGSTELALSGNRLANNLKISHQFSKAIHFEAGMFYERYFDTKHVTVNVWEDKSIQSNILDFGRMAQYSVFGQLQAKLRNFDLVGGTRLTSNSLGNYNNSARISTIYYLDDTNALKFILGQSFRTPTLLELYFNHPTVIGNKDLKPETSHSAELAYIVGKKNFFLQLLGYYHHLDNLIQRVTPASGPPSIYQNVNGFNGGGIEFETKYSNPGKFDMFFNYNYMQGFGKSSSINYIHIPKHTIKTGFSKNFGDFFVSENCYLFSAVTGNPKIAARIPAQFMTDFHLGYRQVLSSKKIEVKHTLSLKNLTNSTMLIPEYIRQTDNINSQATEGFGRRVIYILTISI